MYVKLYQVLLKDSSDVTTSSFPRAHKGPQLNEMGVSPGKCALLRSQQLKQLHELLELTAITKEEYEEQKSEILKKMQQL